MRAKLVKEIIQQPFTNNTKNRRIDGSYPLSRIQYEDADIPIKADWDMDVPCPACGQPTEYGHFENGVCPKCAAQGLWQDFFGRIHRYNSRIRLHKAFESKNKR